MVRTSDPTSQILLTHCAANYAGEGDLANLILNIVWLRNTMSRQIVKLCQQDGMPWIRIHAGRLAEESKQALTEVFLKLDGAVFFTGMEPQKSRAKCPRRGWGELVSELVDFAGRVKALAIVWRRERGVENLAREMRKISGCDTNTIQSIQYQYQNNTVQHHYNTIPIPGSAARGSGVFFFMSVEPSGAEH